MAVGSQKILSELADHIQHKRNLYQSAYSADLARLRATHGDAAIVEALQAVERKAQRHANAWDATGHATEVRSAVDRLLQPQDHRLR